MKFTKEHIERLRTSHLGNQSHLGIPQTEETKRKLSIAIAQLWQTPNYRQHMRDVHRGHRGQKRTFQSKLRQSETMKQVRGREPYRWDSWRNLVTSASFRQERREYRLHHQRFPRRATRIELLAQESLARRAIPFIVNPVVEEICQPDLQLLENRAVIFVDGCYWYSCPSHHRDSKPERRMREYDAGITSFLEKRGWKVFRFWEHEIKSDMDVVGRVVATHLKEVMVSA